MLSQSSDSVVFNRDSLKDYKLNEILEKLNNGISLTKSEGIFLEKFDELIENDFKDSSHITKNQVFERVCILLEKGKIIICNLYDKDGKIDDKIVSIHNSFEESYCVINLKHGMSVKIKDNFLYKITYDLTKDEFYLESTGEYYEKINNENT